MTSRVLAFIVGFLFSGLGYLFTKDYYYAIGTFLVCTVLGLLGPVGMIGSVLLWLYALIDVDRKVQHINAIE